MSDSGDQCTLLKKTGKVIAIRREDQSVWERRAPFAPANVAELTKNGVKVIVQPANRRAYPVQAYVNAGAVIQEDISEASVVFGMKQVLIDLLLPNKTYSMVSHTIKAQDANMAMLDAILEKHIGSAHNYRNSMMARQALRDAGHEIALGMMPKSIGPVTFVFTGSGNVSHGAQEIFQELPHEYVPPSMLQKFAKHGGETQANGMVLPFTQDIYRPMLTILRLEGISAQTTNVRS